MEIPREAAQIEESGLPKELAELPEAEAPEAQPYLISFAKYNEKLCEIDLLNGNKAKRAIEVLKKIGMKVSCQADFQRQFIDRIPVVKSGDYKRLYSRLSEDIELKEIKLQQSARIFYFDIEPERTLYVVAITENHFETDKVRR